MRIRKNGEPYKDLMVATDFSSIITPLSLLIMIFFTSGRALGSHTILLPHLSFADDEERVSCGALTDNVIRVAIMSLKGRERRGEMWTIWYDASDHWIFHRSHGWTDGRIRFRATARTHNGRSVKENVTSSKTSASLLRTSSGSAWKEGTLRGERSQWAGRVTDRSSRWRARARAVPAEEVHVLGMFDDAASHHDGLEILPVNGPELDVSQRWKTHEAEQKWTKPLKYSPLTEQIIGNISARATLGY